MQRAAICCEQIRLSVEPHSSHLFIARAVFEPGQNAAADPGIPRTDDRVAAHAFQRARRASYSRGNIEIIDVDEPAEDLVRVRPEFRTRRDRALNATK
jgi:hypothetical protein